MADLHPDIIKALNKVARSPRGRKFDQFAERKYGIHGKTLAARQLGAEGGGTTAHPNTSPAGARGPAQFMPPTAAAMRRKYGLNPYGSDRQAVASLMQYDMERGSVARYNPGMPSYTNLVLNTKLPRNDVRALRRGGRPGAPLDPRAKQDTGLGGSFSLQGPSSTQVGLQSSTIPGQSFAPERDSARQDLLLGGPLTLKRLLSYKTEINSLQDVPAQKVYGDLAVQRTQGARIKVKTKGAARRGRGPVVRPNGPTLRLPRSFSVTHQTAGLPGYPARDIFAKPGTAVLSPVNGRIVKLSGANPSRGAYEGAGGPFGYSVYVKGENGHTYFLTHFGSRNVKVGQRVRRGQVLGRVGNYPGATPDHIHEGRH